MTLKPEFLPVGSIVNKHGTPYAIQAKDIPGCVTDNEIFNFMYSPIQLTPEILTEWCAAKCEIDQYRIGNRLFIIRDGKIFDYGSNTQLDYLHELQLLFLGFKQVLPITIK